MINDKCSYLSFNRMKLNVDFIFYLQSGILHIGDQLVAVDGESLQDVSYNEVSTMQYD